MTSDDVDGIAQAFLAMSPAERSAMRELVGPEKMDRMHAAIDRYIDALNEETVTQATDFLGRSTSM